MAIFFKNLLWAGAALLVISCEPDEPPTIPNYNGEASRMVGTWRYDSLVIKGQGFVLADAEMIPGLSQAAMRGLRAELSRRLVNYMPNGTYELVWDDRGDYQLGVDTMQSWQPNYGYWQLDDASMSLIHNNTQYYQTNYDIKLLDANTLVRSHFRRMAANSSKYGPASLWAKNEMVIYTEYFSKEAQVRY